MLITIRNDILRYALIISVLYGVFMTGMFVNQLGHENEIVSLPVDNKISIDIPDVPESAPVDEFVFSDVLELTLPESVLVVDIEGVGDIWVDKPKMNDILIQEFTSVECLAYNIFHEARGESVRGQEVIAQVTLNRDKSKHFPDGICEVIRESAQFSWTRDGRSDLPSPREYDAYVASYKMAVEFIHQQRRLDMHRADDIINYHSTKVKPDWSNLKAITQVDNHIVYVRS